MVKDNRSSLEMLFAETGAAAGGAVVNEGEVALEFALVLASVLAPVHRQTKISRMIKDEENEGAHHHLTAVAMRSHHQGGRTLIRLPGTREWWCTGSILGRLVHKERRGEHLLPFLNGFHSEHARLCSPAPQAKRGREYTRTLEWKGSQ